MTVLKEHDLPLLCIYHANCDDGLGAAWAVRKAKPDTEFWAAVHSGKVPDVRGRHVVFVDFCYPRTIMANLIKDAKSTLVLDHHKSSMLDMSVLLMDLKIPHGVETSDDGKEVTGLRTNTGLELPIDCVFDMKRSGAMMAWDHYNDGAAPKFIEYIQDHDLWVKKLPRVDEFTAGLRSYPMQFWVLDQLERWKTFDELLDQGEHILRYKDQIVESAVKNSFWVEIDVPAEEGIINTSPKIPYLKFKTIRIRGANVMPAIASEVGEQLALRYGGMSLTWCEGYKWIYSLRSRDLEGLEAPDVSRIATAFGGGGHHRAAGFKTMGPVHRKWQAPEPEDEDLDA